MTCRRIGSFGSFGSIRLMKYGVMSTRNFSGADSPSRSSSVSSRTCSISSRSLTRWLSCQRQSFHCSSGMSAQIGARRLTAGRPSGPRTWAGSARLTNGASAAARAASWWATAVLISWASTRAGLRRLGRASRHAMHRKYASCKSADDSAMVRRRRSSVRSDAVEGAVRMGSGTRVAGWSPAAASVADDRPEQAHRDEEAREQGDEPERAVRRAGALVRHELQADPEERRPRR